MNTYNKYTVFRTVHSIYEHNDNIVPCVIAFTPCNDMTLTPNLAEYELQDIFDTFDYLLKNQFDLFAKCEQRLRANNIKDEYDVISFLYLMCKNPDFATLENVGFKFINMEG